MTSWMAAGQVVDKPMSVTEWNVSPFPAPDRHSSSLLVASKASHQGWDALMQYAYAKHPLDNAGKPSNWHSHNDPSLLATLPAAALLYRKAHVSEASSTYYLNPGSIIFNEEISPKTSKAIRTASEIGKLVIALPKTKSLPWLKPSLIPEDATIITDYRKSMINPSATSITNDTGELYRNWKLGIYTIDTKQSQAVMGWVGNEQIRLTSALFRLDTPNATVAVQSMDDFEISKSKKILISLATNAVPYKDLQKRSKLPFRSMAVKGTIEVTAVEGLHLFYISNQGKKTKMPIKYEAGKYIIDLDSIPLVHWLSLEE